MKGLTPGPIWRTGDVSRRFAGVFGGKRKAVPSFEAPVEKVAGRVGFIDLSWKGKPLAAHKCRVRPVVS